MLAWLHQATASEKEHLEALLKHVTTQGGSSDCYHSCLDLVNHAGLLCFCFLRGDKLVTLGDLISILINLPVSSFPLFLLIDVLFHHFNFVTQLITFLYRTLGTFPCKPRPLCFTFKASLECLAYIISATIL